MKNKKEKSKILIGTVLREARTSLGLTQEYVAETLGLAPRYISDIERDKTKGSLDTLVKLCNIYCITPTYVLKEYLNSVDLEIDNTLSGFSKLDSKEKNIIRHLVLYMNKAYDHK